VKHVRLTRPLGGKPQGAIITVTTGAANRLIAAGDAVAVAR
jgi:hypothetical protein